MDEAEKEIREKLLRDDDSFSSDSSSSSKKLKNSKERQSFDFTLARRLWRILKLSHQSIFDWIWLIALVLILAMQLIVGSYIGEANKGFYDAFGAKNPDVFRSTLWRASFIVLGSAMLESFSKIISAVLSWRWRRTIVHMLHRRYFSDRMFYKLLNFDERVDNPDQRITQDVDNLTSTLAQVLSDILTGPMTIGYYTYLTYTSIGWYAPAIVFGYFVISYILSKIIMGPIVHRVFRQEKLEGDLRFAHVRVRTNAEAIAIYGGVNNVFSYFGSMVNFMILAIPLLNGWPLNINSAGAVALASFQIIMLISGFSKFNNVSQKVSDIAGYASRVGQLFDIMEQLRGYRPDTSIYDGSIVESVAPQSAATAAASAELDTLPTSGTTLPVVLEFSGVSIWTPQQRRLVRNLRLQLYERQSLLIMGPSGCGKSTILRTIGGLWPFFSGVIKRPGASLSRPAPQQVLYLHQTPFLTSGTLKDQVVYPGDSNDVQISDSRLLEILEILDLTYLLEQQENQYVSTRGDVRISFKRRTNREWIELLSPGEQQRLCLARVLFWRPRFVYLDEASSAIDYDIEKAFYQQCRDMGCTIVSVGHSETLKRYHDVLLRVSHDSKWTISDIPR